MRRGKHNRIRYSIFGNTQALKRRSSVFSVIILYRERLTEELNHQTKNIA
jgi:hypothetical protein